MASTPFALLPASDPNSPFFVPPVGTYQNNAGQIVPKNTPSSTFATPTIPAIPAIGSNTTPSSTPTINTASTPSIWSRLSNFSVEDFVFIVLGLLLIAAGVFAFKTTQNIITTGAKYGSKVAEVAAA